MKIIAHRGASGTHPENTRAAFEAAIDMGADMIECDVRTTKDHVPVVIHDDVQSGPKGNLKVATSTAEELVANNFDLLTLHEALDAIDKRVAVYVEIKPGAHVEPIIKELEVQLSSGWPIEKLIIASFDTDILQAVQARLPRLPYVVNEAWSGVRATRKAKKVGTRFITMNQRWLFGSFVGMMAKRGYHLSAYTLNDPKKAQRWAKHGLYGSVTDYPERFTSQ